MSESNNFKITDAEFRGEMRANHKWIKETLSDIGSYQRELSGRIRKLELRVYVITAIIVIFLKALGIGVDAIIP